MGLEMFKPSSTEVPKTPLDIKEVEQQDIVNTQESSAEVVNLQRERERRELDEYAEEFNAKYPPVESVHVEEVQRSGKPYPGLTEADSIPEANRVKKGDELTNFLKSGQDPHGLKRTGE